MQAALKELDKELTWVPHPTEMFVPCEVQSPGQYINYFTRSSIAADAKTVGPQVTPRQLQEDFPDMVKMNEVCEATILHNLRQRFAQDKIYTNIGDILVSLNPYKWTLNCPEQLCSDEMLIKFSKIPTGDEVPPHIFGIASTSYRGLLNQKNQSILISGESGAGKTEATKKCLAYFTKVAGANSGGIESKILESSPIMEAFGNAKTVRNNNSSRFGKWMMVYFNKIDIQICGSNIINYLLEQSRIVSQNPGERNYHIFYQLILCGSLDNHPLAKWDLGAPSDYMVLSRGGTYGAEGIDDVKDFQELTDALKTMDFTSEESDFMFRIAVAVLHLGNILFTKSDGAGCKVVLKGSSGVALQKAADAIGIPAEELNTALTIKILVMGKNRVSKPLEDQNSRTVRDSLSKWLYNR